MQRPLILWGGVDICSSRYNEPPNKYNQHPNKHRDDEEFQQAYRAIEDGHPIVGICRGAQLLSIITGGSLFQHSVPHSQNHSIEVLGGEIFHNTSGCHHQIMRPFGEFIMYGWNPTPVKVWHSDTETSLEIATPEIVWWPNVKALGIQHHPEWMNKSNPYLQYINNLMKTLEIDYCF